MCSDIWFRFFSYVAWVLKLIGWKHLRFFSFTCKYLWTTMPNMSDTVLWCWAKHWSLWWTALSEFVELTVKSIWYLTAVQRIGLAAFNSTGIEWEEDFIWFLELYRGSTRVQSNLWWNNSQVYTYVILYTCKFIYTCVHIQIFPFYTFQGGNIFS